MVELSHRERTVKVKIVYYGPAVGGKTTNLQVLHQHASAHRRGELVSINSAQDRTILFDLLPLKAAGLRGFDLRLQLLAVPGQAMYAATRRLVLKGADSLVFVANSAADRWEENVQSFREMTENLLAHQLDPAAMPLVLQFNKRDLPELTPIEFMDRTLNARKVEAVPAVAIRGEGVLETFAAILTRTMHDLGKRYQIIDVGKDRTLSQWTNHTMLGLFGTTSILSVGGPAAEAAASGEALDVPSRAAPERRTLRVELPEEAVRMAGHGPDARANETLVESYASAAARLTSDLADVREERDVQRRRLQELQQAIGAGHEVLAGAPVESALRAALGPMASSAGSAHASFLVLAMDRSFRAAVLRGLNEDPLLRVPAGVRHLSERFFNEVQPRLHQAADSLDLGEALSAGNSQFTAVVSIPVRTPRGLQGLGMLYFTPDEALPPDDELAHLAALAKALSASLELSTAFDAARQAERSLHMAVVGQAAMHGMEDALTSILLVRDRLAAVRRRADAPAWLHHEFARLSPCLSTAVETGRSLLSFSRGEIQREVVELEDMLRELHSAGVEVELGPGASAVLGDAVLIRLALLALIESARATGTDTLHLMAVAEGGRIKLRVGRTGPAPPEEGPDVRLTGPDLRLAFVHKIAQLHGGHVAVEKDGDRTWTTLTLLPA